MCLMALATHLGADMHTWYMMPIISGGVRGLARQVRSQLTSTPVDAFRHHHSSCAALRRASE